MNLGVSVDDPASVVLSFRGNEERSGNQFASASACQSRSGGYSTPFRQSANSLNRPKILLGDARKRC